MSAHPSELIDEVVRTHLKPALKELGFKSKGVTFYRANGELTEIVSPQKSQWNGAAEAKFTINLGVYWPKVQEPLKRAASTLPPSESQCTLRQRLGILFGEKRDHWWQMRPESDVGAIGKDVVEKVRAYGLPWLARASSLEEAPNMANAAEAAILWTLRGERKKASEVISLAIAKSAHAKLFFRSL